MSSEHLSDEESKELRGMIQELLDVDSGLSSKEVDFLEDVNENWSGNLTEAQGNWISKIYKRIFA